MNKEILAVIPARGGSKGVPNKNIRLLNEQPLISYTIKESLKSKYINRTIVSTDSNQIAKVSKNYGAEVPFLRPDYLATDEANSIDVILQCLEWIKENESYIPEITVLLQCTSPLRTHEDIDKAIEKFITSKCDSLISICEVEHSPFWMYTIEDNDVLKTIIPKNKQYYRRQNVLKTYRINGATYIAQTKGIIENKSLEFGKLTGYVMDNISSIDIDTELDFIYAELLFNNRLSNLSN